MAKENKIIDKPPFWDQACKHLCRVDPVLAKIIKTYKGETLTRKNNGFHTLVRAIVGQQISVKAADSIWNRLIALVEGKLQPELFLKLAEDDLRKAGLSGQKVNYILNVARFFTVDMDNIVDLKNHNPEEIGAKLIEVKGIGKWTVDMFMMFHMHAPDILPLGDLALVNAIKELYGIKTQDKKLALKKIIKISDNWKPYRTVASWYLWRHLDPEPIEY